MRWLPSFVKPFLIFVIGFALLAGGTLAEISMAGTYTTRSIFMTLRLLGLLLMIVSPMLIGLKFFARLDSKSK